MERRDFLIAGTVAVATAAYGEDGGQKKKDSQDSAAAFQTDVKWRMPSSFGTSSVAYEICQRFADTLRTMTGGKFDIQVSPPGELAQISEVLAATRQGTVECCYTYCGYFANENRAFTILAALPFGMNNREFNSWVYHGGGQELIDEFCAGYNLLYFPACNTGTQMGGWFRKEVKTLADMKGLRVRIGGLAGEIMGLLGATPIQIPGSEIYVALEKGDIDAAEWIGPAEDEKPEYYKVAKYYYAPGWWEPGATLNFFVNKDRWEKLPHEYQNAFRTAAIQSNCTGMSFYDHKNPPALARLVQNGAQLKYFSDDIMEAAYTASRKVYADESAKNPAFKKLYDAYEKYRLSMNSWLAVAETPMDSFSQSQH